MINRRHVKAYPRKGLLRGKEWQTPSLQAESSTKLSASRFLKKSGKLAAEAAKHRSSAFLGAGFAGKHERGGGILERKIRNTGAEHGLESVLRPLERLSGLTVAALGVRKIL